MVQCEQTKTFDRILDLSKADLVASAPAPAATPSVPAVVAAPPAVEPVKVDAPAAEPVELEPDRTPPVELEADPTPEPTPAPVVTATVVQATAAPAIVTGTAEQPAAVVDKAPRRKDLRAWQRSAQELAAGRNGLRVLDGLVKKVSTLCAAALCVACAALLALIGVDSSSVCMIADCADGRPDREHRRRPDPFRSVRHIIRRVARRAA